MRADLYYTSQPFYIGGTHPGDKMVIYSESLARGEL